jgi:ABC-2 type transport system ATP-binding protein
MLEDMALSLVGVTKSYGEFTAVKDLSFSVKRGSICGFLGPNGAGKTSTVRMILGLSEPSSGKITVLESHGSKVLDRIGFLPEERGLYKKMTALEMIVFLAGLKGIKAQWLETAPWLCLLSKGLATLCISPFNPYPKACRKKYN